MTYFQWLVGLAGLFQVPLRKVLSYGPFNLEDKRSDALPTACIMRFLLRSCFVFMGLAFQTDIFRGIYLLHSLLSTVEMPILAPRLQLMKEGTGHEGLDPFQLRLSLWPTLVGLFAAAAREGPRV